MSATCQTHAPAALLVLEGRSDEAAVEATAATLGLDLAGAGIGIVRIGGAHGIGAFLDRLRGGKRPALGGLCDAGEEAIFRRALEAHGLGRALDREGMERLGFYVCEADLEDELIRCHGAAGVERVLAAERELGLFRSFQQQPAQRGRAHEAQLRRFLGTRSGRKIRAARVLVEALDPARLPRPLTRMLLDVVARA